MGVVQLEIRRKSIKHFRKHNNIGRVSELYGSLFIILSEPADYGMDKVLIAV